MLNRLEKTINRYRMVKGGDRILAAVSGGKDSAVLLHLLAKAKESLGISLIALHINLGIGSYSENCYRAAVKLAELLGVPIITVDLEELGIPIPKLIGLTSRNPCSICGTVKRYLMNFAAVSLGASSVATGHNLDDVMHFILKTFLLGDMDQLVKLKPSTEVLGGLAVAKIKPLVELSGR